MKILKDPVERLLYISLATSFVAVGVGFSILYAQMEAQKRGADRTNQIIEEIDARTTRLEQQSSQQTQYIQCIADFFARSNRMALTLSDLDSCTIMPSAPPASTVSPSKAVVATPAPTPKSPEPSPKGTEKEGIIGRIFSIFRGWFSGNMRL